jgi:adenylate kinase family enzyme
MSKFIILRGNSGSGKSTVALALAKDSATRIAIIDADHYRVDMLFPKPIEKDDLAVLMSQNVLYCLEHGYTVIWDSIFYANDRNKAYLGKFLTELHPSDNFIFNFDVSFEETVRRHSLRPKNNDFTAEEMKEWYHPIESLGYGFEYSIPENNTLEQSVNFVKRIAGL